MSLLRLAVTVLVAVPLFLAVGWPQAFYATLAIAFVAIAAGYAVEGLVRSARGRPEPAGPAEKTATDQDWEVKMLLKKALACENRGEWDQALAHFQQVSARAPDGPNAELVAEHVRRIHERRGTADQA
jgi:hypothetical protein